jgi:hypothetical protein
MFNRQLRILDGNRFQRRLHRCRVVTLKQLKSRQPIQTGSNIRVRVADQTMVNGEAFANCFLGVGKCAIGCEDVTEGDQCPAKFNAIAPRQCTQLGHRCPLVFFCPGKVPLISGDNGQTFEMAPMKPSELFVKRATSSSACAARRTTMR